jgi:hypothetical protein
VGVVDRLDVGGRIGNLTEVGADFKFNFLRGQFDMAIAGGAEAFLEWRYRADAVRRTGSRAYLHLPLILSLNLSKKVSIVGTPGIAYVIGRKVSDDFLRTQPFDGGTVAARFGLGVNYRYGKRSAIHPEITILQDTAGSAGIVLFGVGFNFGSMPSYDDIVDPDGDPSPVPPQPAQPAEPTAPPQPTQPPPSPPPPPPAPTQPPPPEPPPTSNQPIL